MAFQASTLYFFFSFFFLRGGGLEVASVDL